MKCLLFFKISFLCGLLIFTNGILFAQDDDMPHGDDFELDCDICHSTEGWAVNPKSLEFKHEDTGYSLLGNHAFIDCRSCHENLILNHIGHACVDCHTDIHKNELGIQCENCHTPANWDNRQDIFKIHETSQFPLIGIHAIVDCQSCHVSEQQREYKNTPVDCKGCHLNNFMQTLNPAHKRAQFDLNCERCHLPNSASWKQTTYNHTETFRLLGGHAKLECIDCHSNVYSGTSTECFTCHQNDYNRTVDPNHVTFGFPTVCEACHNSESWEGTSFDHVSLSGFELNGVHNQIQCIDCHVNNQLTGLARDCYGCHSDDYNLVADPNHNEGGFSQNCITCHSETAWEPATFDHNQTNFALTGAHISTDCADCHQNGQFAGTPTDCFSCHETDYNGVDDPNHVQNNFDKDCTTCHSTNAWEPATFDHNQTNFQLTGAHILINCIDCHENGQFAGTPTECFSCHETDYNSVDDPNHVQNNFNKDCTTCHSITAWEPQILIMPRQVLHSPGRIFLLIAPHVIQRVMQIHG